MDKLTANELRIGNLVLFSDNSTIFEVTGIEIGGLYVKNQVEQTWIEIYTFEPIPLTEEWLLRLGFDKLGIVYYIIKKVIEINYFNGIVGIDIRGQYVGTPHIKYVHQLQNLYFALTGEELTIKSN